MMRCDDELLHAGTEGLLEQRDQEALEHHRSVCPRCRRLFDELVAVQKSLRALPRIDVPAHFVRLCLGRLHQPPAHRQWWEYGLALGAAATGIIALPLDRLERLGLKVPGWVEGTVRQAETALSSPLGLLDRVPWWGIVVYVVVVSGLVLAFSASKFWRRK
ncbi:MAG: hypothetical protein HY335_00870 [Deinococcus sp.]|nr:hypothetical protein [Deinococcus sp.]